MVRLLLVLLALPLAAPAQAQPVDKVRGVMRQVIRTQVREEKGKLVKTLEKSDVPAMLAVLGKTDNPEVMMWLCYRLKDLQAFEAIPVQMEAYRRTPFAGTPHPLEQVLGWWGYRVVGPALRGMKSDDYRMRMLSARLLAERAPFTPHDKRLLPAYLSMVASPDKSFRLVGVQALARHSIYARFQRTEGTMAPFVITNYEALVELAKVTGDPDYEVSHQAADHLKQLLVSHGLKTGTPSTYDRFVGGEDKGFRVAALSVLAIDGRIRDEHYQALAGPEPKIRAVAEIVMRRKMQVSVPKLAVLLDNPSSAVQRSAARLLGWTLNPEALPHLRKALSAADNGTRMDARRAIDRIEN